MPKWLQVILKILTFGIFGLRKAVSNCCSCCEGFDNCVKTTGIIPKILCKDFVMSPKLDRRKEVVNEKKPSTQAV